MEIDVVEAKEKPCVFLFCFVLLVVFLTQCNKRLGWRQFQHCRSRVSSWCLQEGELPMELRAPACLCWRVTVCRGHFKALWHVRGQDNLWSLNLVTVAIKTCVCFWYYELCLHHSVLSLLMAGEAPLYALSCISMH